MTPDGSAALVENVETIAIRLGWALCVDAIELVDIAAVEGATPQQTAEQVRALLVLFLREHRDSLIDSALEAFR
jgi:hypothetical protein